MTITKNPDGTRRSQFDACDPNLLPDLFRKMAFGSFLQGQAMQVRRQIGTGATGSNQLAVSNYTLATQAVLPLPDGGKCSIVQRCTVMTAGVVVGEFTCDVYGTAAAITRHCGPAACGDLQFLAADAVTWADVIYVPERGDVIETYLNVIPGTGVCAIPAWLIAKGIVLLEEAEVVTGTAMGAKMVLIPLTAAPAAGYAQLDLPKANVRFAVADVVSRVRVKVLVAPAEPLADVLEHASDTV
jgi:hypothetical protein